MTEETIDDVKQAYELLFKAHGKLQEERDALLDKVRDYGGRMTDEQSSTLAELDEAIAARAALAAQPGAVGEPEFMNLLDWKPGANEFKDWCAQWFGPDSDESHLGNAANALLAMAGRAKAGSKSVNEFDLRCLLAEERETNRQLVRALREATEPPTFMGEPVVLAARPSAPTAVEPDERAMANELIKVAAWLLSPEPRRKLAELEDATHIGHRQFHRAYEGTFETLRLKAIEIRNFVDAARESKGTPK